METVLDILAARRRDGQPQDITVLRNPCQIWLFNFVGDLRLNQADHFINLDRFFLAFNLNRPHRVSIDQLADLIVGLGAQ